MIVSFCKDCQFYQRVDYLGPTRCTRKAKALPPNPVNGEVTVKGYLYPEEERKRIFGCGPAGRHFIQRKAGAR